MYATEVNHDEFWSYVHPAPDGCWYWTGPRSQYGYGAYYIDGKLRLAHRIAYRTTYGDFDARLCVCHTCDRRICVRPSHLFLGTRRDNIADRHQKGRTARGESQWLSKLTEAQVAEIKHLWATRSETQRSMARRFGVCKDTIYLICAGKNWRHVQ